MVTALLAVKAIVYTYGMLTPQDAKNLLTLLADVNIKGSAAPTVATLQVKLTRIAEEQAVDPEAETVLGVTSEEKPTGKKK